MVGELNGNIQVLHWLTLVAMVTKFWKFQQNCHMLACICEICQIFAPKRVFSSVVTVSWWLRMVGFGAVLSKKKLWFRFCTVGFSDQHRNQRKHIFDWNQFFWFFVFIRFLRHSMLSVITNVLSLSVSLWMTVIGFD